MKQQQKPRKYTLDISREPEELAKELNRLFRQNRLGLRVAQLKAKSRKENPTLKMLRSRPFVRRSEIQPSFWNSCHQLERQGVIESALIPSIIMLPRGSSYVKPVKYYYLPKNRTKLKAFEKKTRKEISKDKEPTRC